MATLPVPPVLPTPKPDLRSTRAPTRGASGIRMFFWRQRMWFESTFVLTLLEPWEKFLLLSILIFSCVLIVTGLFKYLPHHLDVMHHRAVYYIWGQDGGGSLYFWQWLRLAKDAGDGVRGLFMDL